MPNNIAVSITADVADLQVKRAILSSELKAAQKDLNDFAKTARTSGSTDALRASMLGAADAAAKAKNSIGLIDTEMRRLTAGAGVAGRALNQVSHGSSTVTREILTLFREAGRGNFTRMAGSATILAGALGYMTPAVLTAAAAIAAGIAPIALFGAAAVSAAADAAKFGNATQLTGNYAGLTASAFEAMAQRVATASNTGIGTARNALMALVSSGRFTGAEIEQLGADATKFGELTHESADKVLAGWIKMADGPSHFAEEFNKTYHALTLAQIEHITNLEHEGQQSQATAELVRDLTGWLKNQTVEMDPLTGAWHALTEGIDGAWEAMKRFSSGGGTTGQQLQELDAQIARMKSANYQQQHVGSDAGAVAAYQRQIAELERLRAPLAAKVADEQRAADATAAATRVQAEGTEAYQKSHETLLSLRSSADAARQAVKDLHDEMAARLKANPNDAEAKAYEADPTKTDQKLMHRLDPGDFKTTKPKDDQVQVWDQELQTQLEDEKNFYADSKAEQLKFWQDRLALTSGSVKDEREVKTRIYNLEREIAQQSYQDQIASYGRQIEAAKGNWAQQQALMGSELIYIKLTQGEKSKAVETAEREDETRTKEHGQVMLEISRANAQEALAELRSNLDAQKAIREADARTAESAIKQTPQYQTPVGRVQGDQQLAVMHQQMLAQQMAADQAYYAAANQLRLGEMAAALVNDGVESEAYIKAVDAKKLADLQFANQNRQLADQMVNQASADAEKIKADWHSTVDPMVGVTAAQIRGLIEGTETWGQAIAKIGDQALNLVIEAIERMVEQWIVNTIVGTAATKTSAMSGAAAYAGMAGAAGVASMAAAPWPLDMTAPAFGASMFAAALSFGALAQGVDVVPTDMITQIHAGERVMPAADNSRLMAALSGGGAGGGNTFHAHYSPNVVAQGGAEDLDSLLEAHGHQMIGWLKKASRDGKLKGLMN